MAIRGLYKAFWGSLCLALALVIPVTISQAHVHIHEPNGGEVFFADSTFTIVWHIHINHTILNWDLWLSTDNGGTWNDLVIDYDNAALSYDWTIPNVNSTQCLIRIRMDNVGTDYWDTTDAPFTIIGRPIGFERAYGGTALDWGNYGRQTTDGGYVIVGGTYSFGPDSVNVYMIKTDSLGNTLWTKTFGDTDENFGTSVQQTMDGGYIIAGGTYSYVAGSGDVYLIKTNSFGDSIWTRTYGGTAQDEGRSVQQTSDGGYIITGHTSSFGAGSDDVYLIKTNSLGDTLWTSTYGDTNLEGGHSVQQTLDGGYIITGHTSSFGAGGGDVYLIKTDSLGDTLWTKTYGGINFDAGNSVQQTLDGGYIIAGNTSSFGAGNGDVYLIKTDPLGDTLWTKTFGGASLDEGWSVQQTSDGGYVIAGRTSSFGAGGDDVYLIKTDSMGDSIWTKTYGCTDNDNGKSVQQTSDGGFIIGGTTNSFGAGLSDVYLINTDSNGVVVELKDGGVFSLDAPGDTVFSDSTYAVQATVRNFRGTCLIFDVIATIDGYSDTVQVAGLAPNTSFQVNFNNWQVPSTDSTTFTMTVCTNVSLDSDITNDCAQKSIFAYIPVGIEETIPQTLPTRIGLYQNHPNPFHHSTVIRYQIPSTNPESRITNHISLRIYDLTGRLVETLVDERQDPGVYQVQWEGKDQPTGIYFYRLQTGDFTTTKKLTLIK